MESDCTFFNFSIAFGSKIFGMVGILIITPIHSFLYHKIKNQFGFNQFFVLETIEFSAILATAFNQCYSILTKKYPPKIQFQNYIIIGVLIFLSKTLINYASLHMTNYMINLFDSCGLVPFLIGNIVILEISPPIIDILSIIILIFGLTLLSISGNHDVAKFDNFGIVAIFIYPFLNSFSQNLIEKHLICSRVSQQELIGMVYCIALSFALVMAILSGHLFTSISLIWKNYQMFFFLVSYAATSALEAQFIYLLTKQIGCLKVCVILSFIQHIFNGFQFFCFTPMYIISFVLILTGIWLLFDTTLISQSDSNSLNSPQSNEEKINQVEENTFEET